MVLEIKQYIFSFLLLLITNTVFGQIEMEYTVDKTKVSIDETFTLKLSIYNSQGGGLETPNTYLRNNFNIVSGPNQSRSFQSINGVNSSVISVSYDLKPKRTGKFTIPPMYLIVEGKKHASKPVSIEVIKGKTNTKQFNNPPKDENLFVKILASKHHVTQGDKILITYKLYSRHRNIQIKNIEFPEYNNFWKEEIPLPKGKNIWEQKRENINGLVYDVYTLSKIILYPQKKGTLSIKPAKFQLIVGGFSFFSRGKIKNVSSNPINIHVKPFPKPNPSNFSNLNGRYQIRSSISKNNVLQNEAITYTVKIIGTGNIKRINTLPIKVPDGFDTYDPTIKDNLKITENGITGSRTFSYVFIPQYSGTYQIPSFSLPYYDPITKTYKEDRSQNFTIQVQKDTTISNIKTTVVSQNNNNLFDKKEVVTNDDIHFIHASLGEKIHSEDTAFFRKKGFWTHCVLPAFMSIFFYCFQIMIFPFIKKRRNTLKTCIKALTKAEKFYNTDNKKYISYTQKAIGHYLKHRFNIEPTHQKKDTIIAVLSKHNVNTEHITQLVGLLEELDFYAYTNQENIENKTSNIIDRLRDIHI